MFIYLAGSLTYNYKNNQFELSTKWRKKVDNWAKDNIIKTFNPAITFLKEKSHNYNGELAVLQNEYYINKADIAIVDMNNIDYSPGTIYELVQFKNKRIPVLAFGINNHWSPHINSCVTQYLKNIDDVIEVLNVMFDQK